MAGFHARWFKADSVPEIVGAAGLVLGAAGALRLVWPVNYRVGDGNQPCGSAVSRQSNGGIICSHMLGTAALNGGLLVGFGAAMFVLACVQALRSGKSAGIHGVGRHPY